MSKKLVKKSDSIWRAVQGRGMSVSAQEVDNYHFDHFDYLLVSSMMGGCKTVKDISEDLDMPEEQVRERLLYPVRCAWISRELAKAIESRLGQIAAAVYNRALQTGDPNAAKFLFQQYGKFKQQPTQHQHVHINLENMSDEQIDKLIEQKKRSLNIDE